MNTENTFDALALIKSSDNTFDCMPIYEALVAQKFIIDVWVNSNTDHIIFHASICTQFVGVMDEVLWTETTTGFIEDGLARKGVVIAEAAFMTANVAMTWAQQESLRLLSVEYGDVDIAKGYGV